MKFSDGEKLILLMLADMYKHSKIKGDFDPDFITHTIHSDNLWGFNWRYAGIPFEQRDTPKEVKQTVSYLDMWSFLQESYEKLEAADKQKIEKAETRFGNVEFIGFDGNNEPHYGIARYLIEHLDRFTSFKIKNLDSHCPTVDSYAAMYSEFEPMRKNLGVGPLNADEIIKILKAAA